MAGSSRTFYRLGAGARIVATTTTKPAKTPPPSSPPDTSRVHPAVLAAALRLADGDPSRLVFLGPTQVEVRARPRAAS